MTLEVSVLVASSGDARVSPGWLGWLLELEAAERVTSLSVPGESALRMVVETGAVIVLVHSETTLELVRVTVSV